MKFTDLFVKRPVLAVVVNLVILIAGLQAIRSLSVRQYPRSDIAVVNVTTAMSLRGYWRTLSARIDWIPAMRMTRLTTIARTGRLTKRSVNFISCSPAWAPDCFRVALCC